MAAKSIIVHDEFQRAESEMQFEYINAVRRRQRRSLNYNIPARTIPTTRARPSINRDSNWKRSEKRVIDIDTMTVITRWANNYQTKGKGREGNGVFNRHDVLFFFSFFHSIYDPENAIPSENWFSRRAINYCLNFPFQTWDELRDTRIGFKAASLAATHFTTSNEKNLFDGFFFSIANRIMFFLFKRRILIIKGSEWWESDSVRIFFHLLIHEWFERRYSNIVFQRENLFPYFLNSTDTNLY